MRNCVILLVGSWCSFAFTSNSFATLMGYGFTATLSQALTPAYGVTVPISSHVDGHFVLDSQVIPQIPPGSPNVAIYRHMLPGGFEGTFGSLDVRADNYLVTVSNNVVQPGGILMDSISIRWASNLTPSLAPIHVNGVTKTTGMFVINLVGSKNLLSSTALPTSLNISSFLSKLSFLADTTDGTLDLVYNVNSLAVVEVELDLLVVPEPNSFLTVLVLFLMGHLLFADRLATPSSVLRL